MWSTGRYFTNKSYQTYDLSHQGERSNSGNSTESLNILDSHRLHRQQFLLNRSKFECPKNTKTGPPSPTAVKYECGTISLSNDKSYNKSDMNSNQKITNTVCSNLSDNLNESCFQDKNVSTMQNVEIVGNENDSVKTDNFHSLESLSSNSENTIPGKNIGTIMNSEEICAPEVVNPLCTYRDMFMVGMNGDSNILVEPDKDNSLISTDSTKSPKVTNDIFEEDNNVVSPVKVYIRQTSRLSLQDFSSHEQPAVTKWERPNKSVKDIAGKYLSDKPVRRNYQPSLTRRSSMSAMPVKLLAKKFCLD